MHPKLDELYNLLPAYYRQKDQDEGHPLHALLHVIGEQVASVEANIEQLYDNWFIETCDDWVVPYIGELIGYERLPTMIAPNSTEQMTAYAVPRRDVANTIRYRRRKGTLQILELLAAAVAGWTAQASEENNTVALKIWPLNSYRVTKMRARCLEEIGPYCYTFNILGLDTPLYTKSQSWAERTETGDTVRSAVPVHSAEDADKNNVDRMPANWPANAANYYGADKSFAIWAKWNDNDPEIAIPAEQIILVDFDDQQPNWHQFEILSKSDAVNSQKKNGETRPPRGYVMVDLKRGRILFPPTQLPDEDSDVLVTYHYGFSTDIGGGEYQRHLSQTTRARLYRVGSREPFSNLDEALQQWRLDNPEHAVIELASSDEYVGAIKMDLGVVKTKNKEKKAQTLQIRAANGVHPVLHLLNKHTSRPDHLQVSGLMGSRFTLDGILLNGRGMKVSGDIDEVNIRHCTLVPGWELSPHGEPMWPKEHSLDLRGQVGYVNITDSIIGSITVNRDEVYTDPVQLHIYDSIIDATDANFAAIDAPFWPQAHAILTIKRSTFIGTVLAHAVELAENSIFTSKIVVQRRQIGCIRFCYLPKESKTPPRFECQDENNLGINDLLQATNYGEETYCRLHKDCPNDIKQGADDGSEMGVYHHLYEPQREENLKARLSEYLPTGYGYSIQKGGVGAI